MSGVAEKLDDTSKEKLEPLLISDAKDKNVDEISVEEQPALTINTNENADVQLKKLKPGVSPISLLPKLSSSTQNEVRPASSNNTKDSSNLDIEALASSDSLTSETSFTAVLPSSDSVANTDLMSLVDLVVYIRRSRMGLIQTPQQLRFCWKAIVDWINNNSNIEASKK